MWSHYDHHHLCTMQSLGDHHPCTMQSSHDNEDHHHGYTTWWWGSSSSIYDAVIMMMMIIIRIQRTHHDDIDDHPCTMQSCWGWWSSSLYDAVIMMMIIIVQVRCSHHEDDDQHHPCTMPPRTMPPRTMRPYTMHRTWVTRPERPLGAKDDFKGLHLEAGARRVPRILVANITLDIAPAKTSSQLQSQRRHCNKCETFLFPFFKSDVEFSWMLFGSSSSIHLT